VRTGLYLDQRHHAVRLDRADDTREAVAGGQRVAGAVPVRAARKALDLALRDPAAIRAVPLRAQVARALPAPECVGADPYRAGRVAEEESLILCRHCLSIA
jgi:hypothetical protein